MFYYKTTIKKTASDKYAFREYFNGSKHWYRNWRLHREDGPAVDNHDGHKEWYRDGKLHRLDGPAVDWAGGKKEWWVEGNQIACTTQEEFERLIRLKAFW